ncbi:MAG TPA: PTS sugar transporter subunit IIA [Polyangiaceae bacterium]|nr:PTS sugar transporter subunit IIA [Polyangiaceae bacterium]
MRLIELLTPERVAIRHNDNGASPVDKAGVIKIMAQLLAPAAHVDNAEVERVLSEREQLQSTGIGEGVAIPHGALTQLQSQYATLVIVPEGVEFAAIDGLRVNILFAVIGPKRATGEHLKTLARVSRLLRNKAFRDRLVAAADAKDAYALIVAEEGERR